MDVNEKVPISYKVCSSIWPPLIEDLRSKINFFVSPARRPPRSAPSLFRHAGKLSPNCERGALLLLLLSPSSSTFVLALHVSIISLLRRRECVMHEWSDRIASCTAISCTSFAGLRPLLGNQVQMTSATFWGGFWTPLPLSVPNPRTSLPLVRFWANPLPLSSEQMSCVHPPLALRRGGETWVSCVRTVTRTQSEEECQVQREICNQLE